jgi:hypothetical protein
MEGFSNGRKVEGFLIFGAFQSQTMGLLVISN